MAHRKSREHHQQVTSRFDSLFLKDGVAPEWARKDDDTVGEGHFPYRFDKAKLRAVKGTLSNDQKRMLQRIRQHRPGYFS